MLEYLLFNSGSNSNFPKYDLYVDANDVINIDVALAGYTKEDIEVIYEYPELIIRTASSYSHDDNSNRKYITNGLAKRKFKLKFNVLKMYEITSCKFENGLLRLTLNLPQKLKEKSLIHID